MIRGSAGYESSDNHIKFGGSGAKDCFVGIEYRE